MLWLNKHARLRDNLSAYIDGCLTPDDALGLERHLDDCEACRRELDELRATTSAMRDLPQAEAPRSFALTPEMLERRAPAPARAAPPLAAGMRLASAAVAVALTVVVVGDLGPIDGNGDGQREGGTESRMAADLEPATAGDTDEGAPAVEVPAATDLGFGTDDTAPSSTPVLPGENAFASCPGTEATTGSVPATPATADAAGAEPEIACAERAGAAQPTVEPGVVEALRDVEDGAVEADSAATEGDGISTLLVLEIILGVALVALLTGTIVEFTLRRRSRT